MRILITLSLAAMLFGCGKHPSPSDAQVAYSVVKYVKESKGYNPVMGEHSSACGVMQGPFVDVKVEVTQRGDYNEEGNYFPVRTKITGLCNAEFPSCGPKKNSLCPPKPTEFTIPEMAFRLTPADFGAWTVAKSE